MNGQDFKESLKNPLQIYCLVSTDSALVDLYVKRFKEAIGADMVNYGSVKSMGKLIKKKILNVLYAPKLTDEIFDQKGWIFIYTDSVDKRTSLYKAHKDCFIELENNFVPYVMKHSDMNEAKAKEFVRRCNNDLGIIINNLKLYNLSDGKYQIKDTSNDIYLWVDQFIKGQPLPNIDESPISIMAVLTTNCNDLLKVKRGETKGMNPYRVKMQRELVKYRTEEELIKIINDCFWLDCSIKKGLIDIDFVKCYLIMKYNNKKGQVK